MFSETKEEHQKHLEIIMEKLKNAKIKANKDKCEFFATNIEFLGHILSSEGLKPDPSKVRAVKNFPVPRSIIELRSFLGLSGYYRKFIKDYSRIAVPLTELLKINTVCKWTDKQQDSFNALKNALTSAPVLKIISYDWPLVLETDASGEGVGGVLNQICPEGKLPIGFYSKKLTSEEKNYPVHEQELLAVIASLKNFRCFLEGVKFEIVTDHHTLQYIGSQKGMSRRMAHWLEYLSRFDYSIRYRPGSLNVVADALSRSGPTEEINGIFETDESLDKIFNELSNQETKKESQCEDISIQLEYKVEDGIFYKRKDEN